MRDLKYLYEFENLLQEANNALVRQAKDEGGIALGYTCYHRYMYHSFVEA